MIDEHPAFEALPDEPANDVPAEAADDVAAENNKSAEDKDTSAARDSPLVQKLDKHQCPCGNCPSRWAKFSVIQDEQRDLEEQVHDTPIVHRHVYISDKNWETESFTINCPRMRAVLSEVLDKYQDLAFALEAPLVPRWERLQALHEQLKTSYDDLPKNKATTQLVKFLHHLLPPSIKDLKTTQTTGTVRYSKIWQVFPLARSDQLTEIVWNDKAFDKLVLPGGEKELAWEFFRRKATSDERGHAGHRPEVVEPVLDHALKPCKLWIAMLLFDEAVLPRHPLPHDQPLSRIDHAFQSRVDLSLLYQDLGARARKQVWQDFFEHFGVHKFDVTAENLDRLSELPLNGREN
ncbi:hypothetical protein N0V88_005208 [Collariella sp. IMI 366227]|nr:hypothetical protein N0V88_005208 [Collariella sp. IMI 366227]